MLNDLSTTVETISSEALDALFAQVPDSQVNANNLKIPEGDDKTKVVKPSKGLDGIPMVDLDNLGVEPIEEKVEDKTEGKTKDKVITPEAKKEEPKKEDTKKEDKPVVEDQNIKDLYKTSVEYLVNKGIFKDFDGRDALDINDEVFAELLEKQVEEKVKEAYETKKKSAGEFGEALLEYLDNGGEADKIIDLFKERKALQAFDISEETSQEDLVSKWYKEVYNWKPERIKKFVEGLKADETLEDEAEDIKSKYEEGYKKQLDVLQKQQEAYKQEQSQIQKQFETNISKAINDNKELDDKRKRFIKDSIFKLKPTEDGNKINDLYIKFAEWQSDPAKYVELAEFILDHDGYLKRKLVETENKVVDKTFKFIKGNGSIDKNKGSNHVDTPEPEKAPKGTDFSALFRN